MKNADEYKRRLKRLLALVRSGGGKSRPEPISDPLEALLLGILGRAASESRAVAALGRLRASAVDLNELRVTSVSELVEVLGADYPRVRTVAESLSRVLNALFNRRHQLDLSWLKSSPIKQADSFLAGLDGVDAHARAVVLLRSLGAHAFPVDESMLALLRQQRCVPPNTGAAEAQAFLERQIRHSDAEKYYGLLKHHAAIHVSRKALDRLHDVPRESAAPAPPAAAPPAATTPTRPDPARARSGHVVRPAHGKAVRSGQAKPRPTARSGESGRRRGKPAGNSRADRAATRHRGKTVRAKRPAPRRPPRRGSRSARK